MRFVIIAILGLTWMSPSVAAKPPLREVVEIEQALLVIGQADSIRKNCPTISARRIRAVMYILSVEGRAKDLGYSASEIDAYTDNDADKARLKDKSAAILAAKGVDTSDPQSYCAVGMTEIQNSSQIGTLLKAK